MKKKRRLAWRNWKVKTFHKYRKQDEQYSLFTTARQVKKIRRTWNFGKRPIHNKQYIYYDNRSDQRELSRI